MEFARANKSRKSAFVLITFEVGQRGGIMYLYLEMGKKRISNRSQTVAVSVGNRNNLIKHSPFFKKKNNPTTSGHWYVIPARNIFHSWFVFLGPL